MALARGPDGGLDAADHLDSSPAMRNDPIGCFEALFGQRLQGQQLSFRKDGRERITDVVKSLQRYLTRREQLLGGVFCSHITVRHDSSAFSSARRDRSTVSHR